MPQIESKTGLDATTESEEMYLITIAMAVEDGQRPPIPVPYLADALDVSRVAANAMVKKLANRGFIEYVPYRGVMLQPDGQAVAQRVLRRRRLWALFFSEQLGLSPQAADTVACEFEHVTPSDVAHRLSSFLGDPKVGPEGKPIPAPRGVPVETPLGFAMSELAVGSSGEVERLEGDDTEASFFRARGIAPGAVVTILAIAEDGTLLVATDEGRVSLSKQVAEQIAVVVL